MKSKKYTAIMSLSVALCLTVSVATAAFDGRVLERNMKGSDVQEVQTMLETLGYDVSPDGWFGSQTQAAIRTFQQDSGIAADGIVGPDTLKALREAGQNQVHRVKRGENLTRLAVLYGSTVSAIMDANDLTDDTIYIGQKLVIPARKLTVGKDAAAEDQVETVGAQEALAQPKESGTPAMMTYKVQRGESTYVIARKFNTTVDAIANANNLSNPGLVRVGQQLLIPSVGGRGVVESFRWPVKGPITSGYGWRTHPIYKNRQFHGGIDIGVPTGTIVRAAASGKVIQSENMGGFGLGVVLDHGNGVTTWYGHNSVLLVKADEKVVRGQAIAKAGSTGVSTGPHVDFRIKVDGNTVNPLYWLP